MSDLVQRLREFHRYGDNRDESLSGSTLASEAADEIERQAKEIEQLKADLASAHAREEALRIDLWHMAENPNA